MILECPACDVKFKIPDGALGDEGRRVRCGKCAHMWMATPDPVDAPKEATAEAPKAAEMPEMPETAETTDTKKKDAAPDIDKVMAGKKHKSKPDLGEVLGNYKPPKPVKSKKLRWLFFGLSYTALIAISGLLWSVLEKPDWWGVKASNGFAFERIELEEMQQIGGDRFSMNPLFKITGTARNVSVDPKSLPTIRVTLKDNEEETIYQRNYNVDDKVVPSGEAVDFVIENLEQAQRRHTHFVVEMGNVLELALRSVDDDRIANDDDSYVDMKALGVGDEH